MTSFSADRPISHPKDDLFGYAPFAKHLADAIRGYPGSDPLVLALHGPWGSGKSTVLNFVIHYLDQATENDRPVVVTFNPWWFSGRENLAKSFLGQLQVVLPERYKKFKKLRNLLGDLIEAVGMLADSSGLTGGLGSKVSKWGSKAIKREPRDVPALKAEISEILKEANKRILVVIDDIDRLTPEEIRQLFTVIKALADFPNVIYLLAFDREVITQALCSQTGLPGERYLEKIVQVPFEMPSIDRYALRRALFTKLEQVLTGTPDGLFDQDYLSNVYYTGIDPLIRVPRDVIRFMNTLSVTYPAVRGEVNPVDFIAIEALRVFLPNLYAIIRSNPERFAGHGGGVSDIDYEGVQAFHQRWEKEIPEPLRESVRDLVVEVFPKVGVLLSREPGVGWSGFDASVVREWHRNRRACHPDILPIYFRLSLPPGSISRQEMEGLMSLAGSREAFANALLEAKSVRRPEGGTKARAILEHLLDHVEDVPEAHIPEMARALLFVGDELIDVHDEESMLGIGNEYIAARTVYFLLKRLDENDQRNVLESAIKQIGAPATSAILLDLLEKQHTMKNTQGDPVLPDIETIKDLQKAWLERVRTLAAKPDSLERHPKLPGILKAWKDWGSEVEVRAWCDRVTSSDEGLLVFLQRFLRHTASMSLGERPVRIRTKPRLDPRWLDGYIDIDRVAERLRRLQREGAIPETAREAVSRYLKEYEILQSGKDPDSISPFDE